MNLLGSLRDKAYDAFVKEYQKPPLNEAELARWAVEREMLRPSAPDPNPTDPALVQRFGAPKRGPTICDDRGVMVEVTDDIPD